MSKSLDNRRERILTSVAFQKRVEEKIASGEYPLETTKCFCGADNDRPIADKDRTGIPHRIVLCKECALLRASPRMTAGAYKAFYNNEYRSVNFPAGNSASGPECDHDWFYAHSSKNLAERLEDFDIPTPKVVVDWGCHVGGLLEQFKERGATTYGIELDKKAAAYAREHGHIVVETIEELIEMGVKADLITMQDVIEHLTDLHEVKKVQKIMHKDSRLYIWTPGFFRCDTAYYFQIAHTYGFCAATLEYVMAELGFAEEYVDESIFSLWSYTPGVGYDARKPSDWSEYISDHIFKPDYEKRKLPRFRGVCKFTKKLLHENMDSNLAYNAPDLIELTQKYKGDLVIVGGGPSVNEQVDEIKALKAKGYPVMAIARMYPWCIDHGITPDFVVSLDCSEEQEICFERTAPGVTYLMALVTRPSLFEKLKDEKCYVFDTHDTIKAKELRIKHGYHTATVINGAGTVVITCFSLGMNMGFSDYHVFGLDLMFPNAETTHADGIAGKSVPQNFMRVEIKGQQVLTTASFVDFANQALDIISVGHDSGMLKSVKFYGESLLNKMWDCQWHYEAVNA